MIDLAHIETLRKKACFVACSGGIDSVVLVHVLLEAGIRPGIIHLNYHLRDSDSEADEAFVRSLAQKHGLEIIVEQADLSHLKDGSGNIQQAARDVRYALFRQIIEERNAQVVLAQHRDDQVETFYLALARNAGLRGLACMPLEKDGIVRPLLNVSKESIRSYAEKKRITWREDVSNASNDYSRNKLRNLILPELQNALPSLSESVMLLVSHFQCELQENEQRVSNLLHEILETQFIPNNLLRQSTESEVLLLFEALGLSPAQLRELLTLTRKGAFVEAGENKQDIQAIYKGLGGFELLFKTELPLPSLSIEEVSELPKVFTKNELYLDTDKLKGELQVRRIQTGDRMRVVGLQGSKLLSDILNNNKAGIRDKQKAVVVTDGTTILWFPGYAVAPEALASEKSERILKVIIEKIVLNHSFSTGTIQ